MRNAAVLLGCVFMASAAMVAGCAGQVSSSESVGRMAGGSSTCDWDGTAGAILKAGDAKVATLDLAAMASRVAGREATILDAPQARELDLNAEPGPTAASAQDPMGLSRAVLAYAMTVGLADNPVAGASLQLSYTGLCFNDATVTLSPWGGSTGVLAPSLELAAALKVADDYRAGNPAMYPDQLPLESVNLMQATTAPPDFGLPRYYVNYGDPATGDLQIVAVYMDGRAANPIG